MGTIIIGEKSLMVSSKTKIILDLNTDAIGLPLTLSIKILNALKEIKAKIDCASNELYKPKFTFSGSFSNLPSITINIFEGFFIIRAEIFADDSAYGSNLIILRIKALSSTLETQENFVIFYHS